MTSFPRKICISGESVGYSFLVLKFKKCSVSTFAVHQDWRGGGGCGMSFFLQEWEFDRVSSINGNMVLASAVCYPSGDENAATYPCLCRDLVQCSCAIIAHVKLSAYHA